MTITPAISTHIHIMFFEWELHFFLKTQLWGKGERSGGVFSLTEASNKTTVQLIFFIYWYWTYPFKFLEIEWREASLLHTELFWELKHLSHLHPSSCVSLHSWNASVHQWMPCAFENALSVFSRSSNNTWKTSRVLKRELNEVSLFPPHEEFLQNRNVKLHHIKWVIFSFLLVFPIAEGVFPDCLTA